MRSACHSAVTALFQTSPFPLQIYNKAYVLTRRGTFGNRRALLIGWNQAWKVLLWRRRSDMAAEELLNAFRHDAPYLFLGPAFAAVGIVSAAFAIHRRKRDSLLVFFALFAALY